MQQDVEQKTIEYERRRVAKELHDEILPALARLSRSLQAEQSEQALEVVCQLYATIAVVRDCLSELHPVDLEELGLVAALNNLCNRWGRLSDRCMYFDERTDDCHLTELQQLFLYRAMQSALRMFSISGNDILLLSCEEVARAFSITVRCVDKRVASAEWISIEKPEFAAFDSWLELAQATVEIGSTKRNGFPLDLRVQACKSKTDQNPSEWIASVRQEDSLFRALAVEAERKQIAAELRRTVFPELDKAMELATTLPGKSSKYTNSRLRLIATTVESIMSELHPAQLAQSELYSSIQLLAEQFRRDSGIRTSIHSELQADSPHISLAEKFAIYRVTQEALNNIERHSGASMARVSVRQSAEGVAVSIEDNGSGIREKRSVQSRGLKIIRERAEEVGALVSWQQAVSFGSGTLVTITLVLPLSEGTRGANTAFQPASIIESLA